MKDTKIFKKYNNRRFYDPTAHEYVNLATIAAQIDADVDVQVLRHTGGQDITAEVLAQILVDRYYAAPSVAPAEALHILVRAAKP